MRGLVIFLLILSVGFIPSHIFSQAGSFGPDGARYLDLPEGFGVEEEKEDKPQKQNGNAKRNINSAHNQPPMLVFHANI